MATIRAATTDDASQICEIYAPIVQSTAISFETEPPTIEEMRSRIEQTLVGWPWLVCEKDGKLQGYVYAGPFRKREAYQWSVEASVYIRDGIRRSGVGRALYTSLFALLKRQKFHHCFAGATLPNKGSAGLHESFGFVSVGTFRNAGFKFGTWHDVGWWQMELVDGNQLPTSLPLKFAELIAQDGEWKTDLDAGLPLLKI